MRTIKDYTLERLKEDLSYEYREINESGGLYDGQKETLVNLYNDIYKTNKDFKAVIHIIEKKALQTIDKLNKNIKKLVLEYKDLEKTK